MLAIVATITFAGLTSGIMILAAIAALAIAVATLTFRPRPADQPSPDEDLSSAERASSLWAEATTKSIEWLCLLGATFLLGSGASILDVLHHAPFLLLSALIIVACAVGLAVSEHRAGRKV